ncbi:phage tail length tape measure family protein [Sphingomonas hankookensis]|uniref:phage tail length tape measure family protein n=1 Tax=Sphingomonas hankookensis TaxID=563996 RepID=UPI003D303DB7
MATRNADVNLIVRAKTEGEKAISSMADALAHLVSGNPQTAELAKNLAALDKAASSLSTAQEKVGASATKQAAAVHAASAGIAEQKARIADLQRGVQILAAEQDKAFVGPRRNGLTDLLKVAKGALRDAEGQLTRFTSTFDRNLSALQTSRSGLLDLKRSTSEVSQAQRTAQGSLAATTAELERQQRAARALNAIRQSQPAPSGKSAEESASVFARAGRSELERSLDAADKLRAAEAAAALSAAERARQEALAAAELERQERAARSINAIRRTQPGPSGKSAEDSASVFARSGLTGVERDFDAADRLRAKLNPLAAIQATFNAELARYRDLAAKARITTEELAQAEAHLKRETDEATAAAKRAGAGTSAFRASVFGLKPYELQNLSYQINDVVTGLASGQRLSQVVAQQGGQILQLFPRVGGAIVGALTNPAVLSFAATIGVIALGISRAADNAERLRNATADLGRRANGGDYKAADVSEQERQLKRLGASAEDARRAVGIFLDAGVPSQSLAQFGRVAKETADILGVDLPDAARQITTAFTGGYQAIAELDDRLNFLNGTQRDHIRQLFEEGRGQEAQTLALGIYTQKMDAATTAARGPWASANRELKKSWDDLLESFSNTRVIQEAIGDINLLANALKGLRNVVDELSSGGDLTEMTADMAEIAALRKALSTPGYTNDNYNIGSDTSPDKLRERLRTRIRNYNDAARNQNRPTLDDNGNAAAAPKPTTAAGPTTQGDTPSPASAEIVSLQSPTKRNFKSCGTPVRSDCLPLSSGLAGRSSQVPSHSGRSRTRQLVLSDARTRKPTRASRSARKSRRSRIVPARKLARRAKSATRRSSATCSVLVPQRVARVRTALDRRRWASASSRVARSSTCTGGRTLARSSTMTRSPTCVAIQRSRSRSWTCSPARMPCSSTSCTRRSAARTST